MEYRGRTLNLAPVNVTLRTIAERLADGLPTRVELQPGDSTRYEFLLVPLVGQLEHSGGYGPGAVAHVPCNLRTDGKFMAVGLDYEPGPWDFDGYENEHARRVVAAFHGLLSHEAALVGHRERTAEVERLAEALS